MRRSIVFLMRSVMRSRRGYNPVMSEKPYAPDVEREHLAWLMQQVEARCKNPDAANIARVRGRFDLEIVIKVDRADRAAINDEFIVDMRRDMRKRTKLEPVIYLEGEEPKIVRDYDPYL